MTTHRGIITIRTAGPDDAAALRELRIEALSSHPEAFAADAAATAAESVARWAERIATYAADSSGVVCVASSDERVIGMLGLVRGHWPKIRHDGTVWGVYVKAEWRGLRVADALMRECFAWARAHGLAQVKLGVVTTNAPAIRCYARCGFTVYGIDPRVILYGDGFYDELLMVKSL